MTWVDIANLKGPRGEDGRDGDQGPMGPVNIGLRQEDPITYDQQGGFTFNLIDGSEQTVNLPIASAQSAGLLGAGGALPTTGSRNISSALVNGTGSVYVYRSGDRVELNLYGVTPVGPVSTSLVQLFGANGVPVGFRPMGAASTPVTAPSRIDQSIAARVFMSSSGRCDATNPGGALYGLISYTTVDAWPTVLPGSPA